MIKLIDKSVSALAVTAVLGGLSLAHPVYAADASSGAEETQSGGMMKHEDGMKRVDERIKELHEKLGVTADQEAPWKNVTSVMRKNESVIHKLVEARNDNEKATAVDDLKSYEKIAAAHEQGLKRLIPVFEKFYDGLTPEQKASADDMFGKYEGRKEDKEKEGSAQKYNGMEPASGGETNDNGAAGNSMSANGANDNGANGSGTMAAPPAGANPPDQSETK